MTEILHELSCAKNKIVIISCGKKKLTRPAAAGELYIGSYFIMLLSYALTIAPAKNVFVLSAKHGLVRLDDRLEPYGLKMGEPGSVDDDTIKKQAAQLGIARQPPATKS